MKTHTGTAVKDVDQNGLALRCAPEAEIDFKIGGERKRDERNEKERKRHHSVRLEVNQPPRSRETEATRLPMEKRGDLLSSRLIIEKKKRERKDREICRTSRNSPFARVGQIYLPSGQLPPKMPKEGRETQSGNE